MSTRYRHQRPRGRKKILAAAVVAGAAAMVPTWAFASTLPLTTKTLGAGAATVASCNTAATISYNTAYSAAIPGYKVSTTPVVSAIACANMAYRVTLSGTASATLAEVTGTLDNAGAASPDFSSSNVSASAVLGVSVVISG